VKKGLIAFLLIVAALLGKNVRADVLVLVHGYLSGAQSWDTSGVTAVLQRHGWRHAGIYVAGPGGIHLLPAPGGRSGHSYYTVDLPSEAPVAVQSFQLREMLGAISRVHGDESVYLVGHSAGGVVARAALVNGNIGNIRALITIASPHLGTFRAEQALGVTDIPFPFSILPDVFGGDIYDTARRSRSLYVDLVRPRPGTLLFWLNSQPHPDIHYFSIVRGQESVAMGDFLVPGYSQDMNNIPVLQGRSVSISIPREHGLDVLDGGMIVNLLSELG
jgi:pimeloyl-ACP methyl ester carboxylesterase